jgi:hypothetical protein
MKTYEIFAYLKPGYKAVCNENGNWEVFVNEDGLFFQVDDFGRSQKFKPEKYPDFTWNIVSTN